jgi:hypothetical protein
MFQPNWIVAVFVISSSVDPIGPKYVVVVLKYYSFVLIIIIVLD